MMGAAKSPDPLTGTDRIPDSLLWRAVSDALHASDPSLGTTDQWAGVAEYAAQRGIDPWPARSAQLASMLDCENEPQLAVNLASGPDGDNSAIQAFLRSWLVEDVAAAAPLLSVFTGHSTDIDHQDPAVDPEDLTRVQEWLTKEWDSQVIIESGTVIGGGFSRRMWRLRLRVSDTARGVVVRVEQGGMFGTDTSREVRVMRALAAYGYPVPTVLAVDESGSVLGSPAFVMSEVPGVVRLDEDGISDIIASIAQLHTVPVTILDPDVGSAEDVMHANLDGWMSLYREHASMRIPLLEAGERWLRKTLRPNGSPVIVHGDPGPGNALFSPESGLTVLDWEFGHVGDPAEDWAYLAYIRGRRIMSAEEWKQRLKEIAGVDYSTEQWRAWLAFNHLRGAAVNLTARTIFERGPRRVADHLAIGVAVHLRFLSQLTDLID